jgi:carboxymethylenebutenolidase
VSVKSEWVRFGEGQVYSGFIAWPERAALPLPGVVVIQEAYGVNAQIEDVTRRIALAGYAALAPDLYSKNGERPAPFAHERISEAIDFLTNLPPEVRLDAKAREAELAKRGPDEAKRIGETMVAVFMGGFLPPVAAAASFLREEHPAARGQKVGSVGFCMGGGLSALLACSDPALAGAIIFYGRSPPLDKVAAVACPVLGFYGGQDAPINATVPPFAEAMKQHGKRFEAVTYEGAPHAFFNDTRPSYHVRAARDAWVRTLAFFRDTLAPQS